MKKNHSMTSGFLVVILIAASGAAAFAQAPVVQAPVMQAPVMQVPAVQNRLAQPVLIGGIRVDAVYILAPGGGIQSFSCPTPQQYVTPDGATSGWACFDAASSVWFLSALPPQQQAAPPPPVTVQQVIQQPVYSPPVIYAQPAIIYREPPTYVYAAPVYYPRVVQVAPLPSVAIGVATINAAGRIAAAAIGASRYHVYYGRRR